MKCPYNNFEECFELDCPAYLEFHYSDRQKGKVCRYIRDDLTPPNASTTIINNYYNKEQN